jgi:sRNA-binding protein
MKSERGRGFEESPQQIPVLRERWPLAFPLKPHDVRPLALNCAHEIATAMEWSFPYTRGVLGRWKMGTAYCRAVLCYDRRIALDGTPAEPVDAETKDLATKHLAKLTARKAKKAVDIASRRPNRQSSCATKSGPGSCGGEARRREAMTNGHLA